LVRKGTLAVAQEKKGRIRQNLCKNEEGREKIARGRRSCLNKWSRGVQKTEGTKKRN